MSKRSLKKVTIKDEFTEFLLYTSPNGEVKVEVLLNNETLWLTQKRIAELYGVQRPAITKHLKNIYEDGELEENSTSSILEHMDDNRQISADWKLVKYSLYSPFNWKDSFIKNLLQFSCIIRLKFIDLLLIDYKLNLNGIKNDSNF